MQSELVGSSLPHKLRKKRREASVVEVKEVFLLMEEIWRPAV
jgi:hypothetical protein